MASKVPPRALTGRWSSAHQTEEFLLNIGMDRVRAVFPMATSKIAVAMESMGDILESGVEESYVQRRGRYAQEANTGLQGDEFWRNLWV